MVRKNLEDNQFTLQNAADSSLALIQSHCCSSTQNHNLSCGGAFDDFCDAACGGGQSGGQSCACGCLRGIDVGDLCCDGDADCGGYGHGDRLDSGPCDGCCCGAPRSHLCAGGEIRVRCDRESSLGDC